MNIEICKFGGDFFNVRTISSFRTLFLKMRSERKNVLFVVSAKNEITRFLRLLHIINTEKIDDFNKDLFSNVILKRFFEVHLELINSLFNSKKEELGIESLFQKIFTDLNNLIKKFKEGKLSDEYKEEERRDMFFASLLKFGELASSAILGAYLKLLEIENKLVDARNYVFTNSFYKSANILFIKGEELRNLFTDENKFIVTQGFIGTSLETKKDTVLGMGGSDLSASVFSSSLHSDSVTFYCNKEPFFSEKVLELSSSEENKKMIKIDKYKKLEVKPIRLDAVEYLVKAKKKVFVKSINNPLQEDCVEIIN